MIAWDDVLHEGPLANVPPDEFRRLRARFLSQHGWGDPAEIAEELRLRDELVADAVSSGHPVGLWFEHDLFDQLQLLQVLSILQAAAPGQVELVQPNDYLGAMDADDLERLWQTRTPVDRRLLELGASVWRAVCDGNLDDLSAGETSALPYLGAGLQRLGEERLPLPRTRRQLLEALADGPRRPLEAFALSQAREEAVFLGDAWCFAHLSELVRSGLITPVDGAPLPPAPPRGDYDEFARVPLELTDAGRALVSVA